MLNVKLVTEKVTKIRYKLLKDYGANRDFDLDSLVKLRIEMNETVRLINRIINDKESN